ncbi:type VII secretion protein EccCb [uncultured Mycolicibacterium sp.]|uniref:type VII secretion protein EccCb n=1 Tax=uncultured Mycolicibacterium sp. TaxID=2320817 RepID=UPI00262BDBEC|nr:type VII secretion protein EccCb [uncultured Mycolicibacterium sp.]
MDELDVRAPPEVPRTTPGGWLRWLLPALTVLAVAGMFAVYLASGAGLPRSPMFALFPVMLLTSAVGTLIHGARGTGRAAELDRDRREYLRYLDGIAAQATAAAAAQRESMLQAHPPPEAVWELVGGPRMWCDHPVGAAVRIGTATAPAALRLVAPQPVAPERADPVTACALRRLLRDHRQVSDVPECVRLLDHDAVAVAGPADQARALVRAVLCRLAVQLGPDRLHIAAVGDDAEWDWLKWLPHHRRSLEPTDARQVMVVDGADPTPRPGTTTIVIGDGPGLRLTVGAGTDRMSRAQARACARLLAAHRADGPGPAAGRREWTDLVGIDDPAGIEAERLWAARPGGTRLRVPIGVDEAGGAVDLDLKEAARGGMGPHGLCVGATGSGKSEFLRTLVLGLVCTHRPEELNLVLVDFKGGATFTGLDRCRHVAAVITNLAEDAHLVDRMHDALAGELYRRQHLLRDAGVAGIDDYRRHAPLPTLLVVVDEFSELLSQHPDFADLFVAVGRLGRSLGVHLLLASQRIDEGRLRGLDSHLSYRICLKTFSAAESRAALGIPDAYELPNTPGAAYLKTVDGRLVRFRTAYVSGRYRTRAAAASAPARPRRFTAADPAGPPPAPTAAARSLFDTVVDRLAGHGPAPHPVWLPPLQHPPPVGELLGHGGPLAVPVGVVDCPFEQCRVPLVAELDGATGNVAVVGGPRSGKSTALCTLVLALAAGHDPAEAVVYGIDLGGGTLSWLTALPHVGAVAGRTEPDLVRRIVARTERLLRRREAGETGAHVFLVVDGWAGLRRDFEDLEAPITALAGQGLAYGIHVVVAAARWAELRPALKDQLGTRIELRLGDPAESEMDRRRARNLLDRPAGRGITRDGREFVIALPRLDAGTGTADLAAAIAASGQALRIRAGGRTAPPITALPGHVPAERLPVAAAGHVPIGLGDAELEPVALDFVGNPHLVVVGEAGSGKTAALRTLCRQLRRVPGTELAVVDYRRGLLGEVETGYAGTPATAAAMLGGLAERLRARLPGDHVTHEQLRTRSWWQGPEVYVVVDDYDLAAGAATNPVGVLAELLPHAGDIGLHLVLARRGAAGRAMFDPIPAAARDLGGMGLVLSTNPEEGVVFGVRAAPRPPGRGVLVTRAGAELVQIGWTDPA